MHLPSRLDFLRLAASAGLAHGADLGSVFPEVAKLAGGNRYELAFPNARFRNFAGFRREARAKVFDVLQYRPAPVDPRPEVIERLDLGDYIRERIRFSTTAQFRVPAYVLIPKNLGGRRAPGIVDLHSHGGMFAFGKEKVVDLGEGNHAAMPAYHRENYDGRPTATELVRRGYVVISIDAFLFGERRAVLETDELSRRDRAQLSATDVKQLNGILSRKESTLAKSLVFAGLTWPGIVAWDDIRTVDYLSSRPEVDPLRIGCLGISMGGYRSLFLTALDERIRAGCVTGFMSTTRPMLERHIDTHSWIHFLPGLHRYLDWPDVASLTAPRALLVQQCRRDELFPPAGMQAAVERIAELYRHAGVPRQFEGRFYEEPHRFSLAMQEEAFAWLDSRLKS